MEPSLRYHLGVSMILTARMKRAAGQCLLGSLTGAVASKRVTEARNGSLAPDGNRSGRVFAQVSLTVRLTSRAGRKRGESDPATWN